MPKDEFKPLKYVHQMITLLAEITGEPEDIVRQRLIREIRQPGRHVSEAFEQQALTPHVHGQAMNDFYQQTDAFLYELAVWNGNRLKRNMSRWIARWLNKHGGTNQPQKILLLGDGLGFDSVFLARHGHDITYMAFPGREFTFAQRLIERSQVTVTMLDDPTEIPHEVFDVVICLDVLEHVPDPPELVSQIASYLKPGGVFFSHAPFYMIHPSYPTHIAANRQYSGQMTFYKQAGFSLVDGKVLWSPLVLQKSGGQPIPPSRLGQLKVVLFKPYLCLGRRWAWPFGFVHRFKYIYMTTPYKSLAKEANGA